MKTGTFTSLFAAAAIVGGLAMMAPADAGGNHNGKCNWNGCSTQFSNKNKNINLDLRLRVVVVHQNCNGQACAGGATTGYATSHATKSTASATAGGSTDSYAGAGPAASGGQIGFSDHDSNNHASATSTDGARARASSRQESTSVAADF